MDALSAGYFMSFVVGGGLQVASFLLGRGKGRGRAPARGGANRAGTGAAKAGAPRPAALGSGRGATSKAPSPHIAVPAAARPRAARLSRAGRILRPLFDLHSLPVLACAGGGAGYIALLLGASAAASAGWATCVGAAASYAVGGVLAWIEQGTHYQEALAIEGTLATVLLRIGRGRTGEVVFTNNGARRFLPASSESGRAIELGTEVVILHVEGGIAVVAPIPEVLEEVIHHG